MECKNQGEKIVEFDQKIGEKLRKRNWHADCLMIKVTETFQRQTQERDQT